MYRMTGQYSYAQIILLVTCPENWRANIPITIQCSTVRALALRQIWS